ncbi:MAG: IclR family transcriptional regulator [Chloroflexi bacterium]|nr:IclR family transcriptional regulator [Chloroflexota bacterium]
MVVRDQPADVLNLVPAVDNAFKILQALKGDGREFTIVEIAKELGLNKSTVHRLLATLSYHGVVQRDDLSKRYRLGMALAEYGNVALNNIDIRRTAKPFLKALMQLSGETACLAVLQATEVVIVDKAEPPQQIRIAPHIGWRFPATLNSMGKAMLAWLPRQHVDEIIQRHGLPARTPKSVTDPTAYWAELAATRERGFATDFEEFYDWVKGVAAPIFDARGTVVASLAIAGPAFRVPDESMAGLGQRCVEVAKEISRKL